jgi:hypothetical protein
MRKSLSSIPVPGQDNLPKIFPFQPAKRSNAPSIWNHSIATSRSVQRGVISGRRTRIEVATRVHFREKCGPENYS